MMDRVRFIISKWGRAVSDWMRFGRSLTPLVAELEERETWDRVRLREWQTEQIRFLLKYAHQNVPFYQQRFREVGWHPEDFRSLEDLSRIPPLTKADIRAHWKDLFARGCDRERLKEGRTGGSTGEPTPFFRTAIEAAWHVASVRRCEAMLGIRPGDVMVKLGGVAYAATWRKRLYSVWERWMTGSRGLTSDYLDDSRLTEYIRVIGSIRARVVGGYPSALYLLATRMLETGLRLPFVEVVWTSSETLHPFQRERLREAFRVEPFDTYGAGDAPVASECIAHAGLHLFQNARLIEIVKENGESAGPGEVGRVLVTTFYNRDWPYIRYDLSDLVEVAPEASCPCGNRLPRISRVLGRTGDYLVSPDGRMATVANLTLIFGPVSRQVRAYQLAQEDPSMVDVRIVPGQGFGVETESYIRESVSSILGPSVRVIVRIMDDIPATRAGKRMVVVSGAYSGVNRSHPDSL